MPLTVILPNTFVDIHVPEANELNQHAKKANVHPRPSDIVCADCFGKPTAVFDDMTWDCSPFSASKGSGKVAYTFYFDFLSDSPTLLYQAKQIVYGWLYHRSRSGGKRTKISTLGTRFNVELKAVLEFLRLSEHDDICALNDPQVWQAMECYLKARSLSNSFLKKIFSTLNSVAHLGDWLPFQLELPNETAAGIASRLMRNKNPWEKQILAIPQAVADIIYCKAIQLVEQGWREREVLAQLERDLQSNYEVGRKAVDDRIDAGIWHFLSGVRDKHQERAYRAEITRSKPLKDTQIITSALESTGLLPEGGVDRNWYPAWRKRLQTACFICCGAFTGMRISELFELNRNSFFKREIDGTVFNVVRAHTHKLAAGKKLEEWLASPVVEKAIDLAAALCARQREQLLKLADQVTDPAQAEKLREDSNCLWLSRTIRGRPPIVTGRASWNSYLQDFAEFSGAIVDDASLADCRLINPQDNGAIEERIEVGKPWRLTSHQFRRTFAVFSCRNRLCHPIALKQQFKHINLQMTEWYGNGAMAGRLRDVQMDVGLQKLLSEARDETVTSMFDRWHNGGENLSGTYGKAVMSMREEKDTIYRDWDSLNRLVKAGRLSLHGTLHSYCKNGYDCDMDGVVNPAFCVDCSSGGSIIDGENAKWWQKSHKSFSAYLANQDNPSPGIYSHCITQIRAAERVMKDHGLEYVPYKDKIEVVNI